MKRLLAAILLGVILQSGTAAATTYLYVSPTGQDTVSCGTISNPCQTIGAAVTKASGSSEDTVIRARQGDYVENIVIDSSLSQPLAIEGGWSSDYTSQSHDPDLTRLTSNDSRPVFDITAPVLDDMFLRPSSLSFQGVTDVQRTGIDVSSNQTTQLNFTIEHCSFSSFRGNAIHFFTYKSSQVNVILDQNTLKGNFQYPEGVSWNGGGLLIEVIDSFPVTVTLTKNRIFNNQAMRGGVFLFASGSGTDLEVELENNIIAGNTAGSQSVITEGGGLAGWFEGDASVALRFTNNTLAENVAMAGQGSNIYFYSTDASNTTAYLKNTIVWSEENEIYMMGAGSSSLSLVADYSLVGDVTALNNSTYTNKSSNLHKDPLLQTDYHLSPGSPARNAGVCGIKTFIYSRIAPYDDIDGDPRPGWGTLLGCDIGADEYSFSWILFNPAFTREQ